MTNEHDIDFGSGEVTPYIKFNAKSNVWAINDGTEDQVIEPPRMLIDLEHIRKGWLRFREQSAPDFKLDPPGTPLNTLLTPEPETGDYKTGFVVQTYSRAFGSRQFAANSFNVKEAIKALNKLYRQDAPMHPGKLPVCEVAKTEVVTGNYGNNYRPLFSITGWVDRPADFHDHLPEGAAVATSEQPNVGAPPTTVRQVADAAQAPLPNDEIPF